MMRTLINGNRRFAIKINLQKIQGTREKPDPKIKKPPELAALYV